MRRLLIHTLLFLLPVLVMVLVLPVDSRFRYQGLKDDCNNRATWIYDRLQNDTTSLDVVFLGSSRTINGINDRLISENTGRRALNLGYCRLGRNLHFVLLRKLLEQHSVETVVVEVRKKEDRYSHPVFPHLASTKDVLFSYPFFNRDILKDIWTHFAYRIELTQERIFRQTYTAPYQKEFWGYMAARDTAKADYLKKVQHKRMSPDLAHGSTIRDFYRQYARGYLRKIQNLCLEHNARLIFLYLPAYGVPQKIPEENVFYRSMGEVWTAPRAIVTNPDFWYDEDHMNDAGAEALSRYISIQLMND